MATLQDIQAQFAKWSFPVAMAVIGFFCVEIYGEIKEINASLQSALIKAASTDSKVERIQLDIIELKESGNGTRREINERFKALEGRVRELERAQ